MTRETEPSADTSNNRRQLLSSVGTDAADEDTGRRSVLRGTAATALASVGLTGTAAAVDPTDRVARERVKAPFRTNADLRRAVEVDGADVLQMLADRGYIERPSAAELPQDELRLAAWRYDDEMTARVHARLELDDGKVAVTVEPQAGRQYAVVTEGDETVVLDPDADTREFETSACLEQQVCTYDTGCTTDCMEYELYCCDPCYFGDSISCCSDTTSCSDDCTTFC